MLCTLAVFFKVVLKYHNTECAILGPTWWSSGWDSVLSLP